MKNFSKLAVILLLSTVSSLTMAGGAVVLPDIPIITDADLARAVKSIPAAQIAPTTPATTTNGGIVTPNTAASGITYYGPLVVWSPADPAGVSAVGQTSVGGQGGAWIGVEVLQYGYGNPISASLGGYPGTLYQTINVCGPLSALSTSCPAGSIITGFIYVYEFVGPQSGTFTSSAYSIASPFGTHSTSLYIY